MKVGFVAPLATAIVNGGVRTQVLKTAQALRKLGVHIEFISPLTDLPVVDLIHVFSAGAETLSFIDTAKKNGYKIVLSSVFYSNKSASTIAKIIAGEKIIGKVSSGIRSEYSIKANACKAADLVLPNTRAEAILLTKGFGVSEKYIQVIPNGVETHFKDAEPDLFIEKYGIQDFVLFAGQAGAGRKNLLSLMKAAPEIDSEIVIIGDLSDDIYSNQCRELGHKAGNVRFINSLPHESDLLASAYAASKVFVLPSLFETPGIAAMEAALTKSNLAITQIGGTKEYFEDHAEYLDPKDITSIAKAVNKALQKPSNDHLSKHILSNFTWELVADKTLSAYKKLMDQNPV